MCHDHEYRELPPELAARVEKMISDGMLVIGRCLPPLGIHEWCEHDPVHPPPVFRDLGEVIR